MGLKVYVSGMSGNKEVKKRQQRVLMILDSKNIKYDLVDITEPGKESEKEMMQVKSTGNGGTVSDPEPRHPLPPQLFNEEEYCGDYDAFDLANEIDTLEQFLKLVPADTTSVSTAQIELKQQDNADAKKTEEGDENKENEAEQKEGEEEKKGDEEKTADEKEGEEKATAADGDDAAAKAEQEENEADADTDKAVEENTKETESVVTENSSEEKKEDDEKTDDDESKTIDDESEKTDEEAVTAAVTAAAPTVATKSANIVEDAAVQQPTTVQNKKSASAQTVTEQLIQNEKNAPAN